jgi:hypothetical protein
VERNMVFLDLWSRGYYVTAGHGFAADWLVYSGSCCPVVVSARYPSLHRTQIRHTPMNTALECLHVSLLLTVHASAPTVMC